MMLEPEAAAAKAIPIQFTKTKPLEDLVSRLKGLNAGWPDAVERYCAQNPPPVYAIPRSLIAGMSLRQSLKELKQDLPFLNLDPVKKIGSRSFRFHKHGGVLHVKDGERQLVTSYQALIKVYHLPAVFGIRLAANPASVVDGRLLNPSAQDPRFKPLYEYFRILQFGYVLLVLNNALQNYPSQLEFVKNGGIFLPISTSREAFVQESDQVARTVGLKIIPKT